jgi:hypothetical protein
MKKEGEEWKSTELSCHGRFLPSAHWAKWPDAGGNKAALYRAE